jgi:hypothetical protein
VLVSGVTIGWVDVHFAVNGGSPQNQRMVCLPLLTLLAPHPVVRVSQQPPSATAPQFIYNGVVRGTCCCAPDLPPASTCLSDPMVLLPLQILPPGSKLMYSFTAQINGVAMDSPTYSFSEASFTPKVGSVPRLSLCLHLGFAWRACCNR